MSHSHSWWNLTNAPVSGAFLISLIFFVPYAQKLTERCSVVLWFSFLQENEAQFSKEIARSFYRTSRNMRYAIHILTMVLAIMIYNAGIYITPFVLSFFVIIRHVQPTIERCESECFSVGGFQDSDGYTYYESCVFTGIQS